MGKTRLGSHFVRFLATFIVASVFAWGDPTFVWADHKIPAGLLLDLERVLDVIERDFAGSVGVFGPVVEVEEDGDRQCRVLARRLGREFRQADHRVFPAIAASVVNDQRSRLRDAAAQLADDHSRFQERAGEILRRGGPGTTQYGAQSLRHQYPAFVQVDEALGEAAVRELQVAFSGQSSFFLARGVPRRSDQIWSITENNQLVLSSCSGVPRVSPSAATANESLDVYCTAINVTTGQLSGANPGAAYDLAFASDRYRSHFDGAAPPYTVTVPDQTEWSLQRLRSPGYRFPRGITLAGAEDCVRTSSRHRRRVARTRQGEAMERRGFFMETIVLERRTLPLLLP